VENVGTLFEAHAPSQAPLVGVVLRNVTVASAKQTTILENVHDLRFDGVTVAGRPVSSAEVERGTPP
jgi:hypothetical protein